MEKKYRDSVIIFFVMYMFFNITKVVIYNTILISESSIKLIFYKGIISAIYAIIINILILKIARKRIFIIIYLLQMIYMFITLTYFIYFRTYFHISQSIMLSREGIDLAKNFSFPIYKETLILFLDFPFFLLLILNLKNLITEIEKINKKRILVFMTIAMCLLLTINYYKVDKDYWRFASETELIKRYGVIINDILNFYKSASEEKIIKKFNYGSEIKNNLRKGKENNIIIIQVESLDAGIIDLKYNNQLIAPFLTEISKKNIYYPYTLSYHYQGTIDTEFTVLNSIEPLDDRISFGLKNYNYPNSVLKELPKNYKKVFFHNNFKYFYNRNIAYNKMGIDEIKDLEAMKLKEYNWGATDGDIYNYIEKNNVFTFKQENFFYYIVTMSSHSPFKSINGIYRNSNYSNIKKELPRNYFNSISYVDGELRKFIEYCLENTQNTYIVIYGDHTAGINSQIYESSAVIKENNYFQFVPLIIITPDKIKRKEEKYVACFQDIAPTVLYNSNITFEYKTDGVDLVKGIQKDGEIPFKGKKYKRSYLYNLMKEKISISGR